MSLRPISRPLVAKAIRIVEIREYTCKPDGLAPYLQLASASAHLRQDLMPGWRLFATVETGAPIHKLVHVYSYESLAERERVRSKLQSVEAWKTFLSQSRPHLLEQASRLFWEDAGQVRRLGGCGAWDVAAANGAGNGAPHVYELRSYRAGNDGAGEPSEEHRGQARLMTACLSAWGKAGRVAELWRYPNVQALMDRRLGEMAADGAREEAALGAVILRPTAFSPWQ